MGNRQVGMTTREGKDSMATIETMDFNEYLVDMTDGMERELEIGDWEQC